MAAVYSYTSYFFTEPAMGAPVCLSVTLFSPLREWPAHPTPWGGPERKPRPCQNSPFVHMTPSGVVTDVRSGNFDTAGVHKLH
jgi:hypothetical protein